MATPARKTARARRPFAVLASPSPSLSSGNVGPRGMSFSQCLHRFRKFSGEASPVAPLAAGRAAKNKERCCASRAPKKPVARTPRTASRRRLDSSRRVLTSAAAAAAAYDAPRAPLWDFSEEGEKVRAKLSSPYDEAEELQERRRGDGGGAREASRKRTTRSVALDEVMAGLPEPGDGRVRYLVHTFERLLSLPDDADAQSRGSARRRKKGATRTASSMRPSWLPPPPPPPKPEEIDMSYPSRASSSEVSFHVGFAFSDGSSFSSSRRSSARHQLQQKRRCSSFGLSERKATGVTSQHPFNLMTEQRGRVKEENLVQRMRKKLLEEERMRNPLAQGLPWTTDEPENTMKPRAKEPTEPFDVVLHSELRAFGRARFDHQVAERNSFFEKLEMERERQRKLDEEIEIKQLRKERAPRAHPMPDFSRPFVPKRSVKPQTVPREPRFQPRLMRHNSKA